MRISGVAPKRIIRKKLCLGKKSGTVSRNTIILLMCIAFTIIGMLLLRNEINEDDWYIEATADGLFGNNNRSLMTLCANYIVTGIIYLLSLTGIRLFWLHWIFVVFNCISSYLVCKLIMLLVNRNDGYVFCFTFLSLITPLVYFYMQTTLIAAYVIATGCLWLFYALEYRKSVGHFVFSAAWIILGASVRIDCFAYAIVFMGILWLSKIIKYLNDHKTILSKKFIGDTLSKYFTPFLLILFLLACVQWSQGVLMECANPGFSEWNTIRSQVDDYIIPDYNECINDYQKIGMSYNDYLLLRSWNNQDPAFFTEDLYKKILEIRKIKHSAEVKEQGLVTISVQSLKYMTGSIYFWVGVILTIYAFACLGIWYGITCVFVILGTWGLTIYFSYIERLIWRVEWPLWIFMIISMLIVFLTPSCQRPNVAILKNGKKRTCVILFTCMAMLLVRPCKTIPNTRSSITWNPYYGTSIFDNYKERYNNNNNYGRYLYAQLSNDVLPYSETEDTIFTSYIDENKDKLYFVLFDDAWKQQFPLTDRDYWHTGGIGAGENWYFLGQYLINLRPTQQRLKQNGIDNPFEEIVNENVRIAVKESLSQLYPRTIEINRYLKEHYYDDANFSVTSVVNHTIIGRYMRNFDTNMMLQMDGGMKIEYSYSSPFEGMSQIWLSDFQISNYTPFQEPAYLEIINPEGETFTCATMDNRDGRLTAIFYNDVIQGDKNYTIRFVYEHYGGYYYINAGTLK